MYTEKKSFLAAFVIWLFTGFVGGHLVYIEEKIHYLLWYWMLSLATLGLAPLVGAFFMKRRILEINQMVENQEKGKM